MNGLQLTDDDDKLNNELWISDYGKYIFIFLYL